MHRRIACFHSSVWVFALAISIVAFLGLVPRAIALPKSNNVVFIGGSTLTTDVAPLDNANEMSYSGGGYLPVEGSVGVSTGIIGDFSEFHFSPMLPSAVSASSLASYDTVVLNMAASAMWVTDPNTLNVTFALDATQKQAIVDWVGAGGKLIIYDSEMSLGGAGLDYSWLPYPFTTNNPGAMGAAGTLTIVEENVLSSKDPLKPTFIDAVHLGTMTDAVGDMNVMTTHDPNWYVDMAGTNVNGVSGPVHTYARYGNGLMIYNGLDQDYQADPTADGLMKIWYLELACAFNLTPMTDLPNGTTALGITLSPGSAVNPVGATHTVTAKVAEVTGAPIAGTEVTITVLAGPNQGFVAHGTTDVSGLFSASYVGTTVGIDQIQASYTPTGAPTPTLSNIVTKEWVSAAGNQPPSVVLSTSDAEVFEGATANASGTMSDPDGDVLTLTASTGSVVKDSATTWHWFGSFPDGPSTQVVNINVTDEHGATVVLPITITVKNAQPTCAFYSLPANPLTGAVLDFSAVFADAGVLDTHTAVWHWGDGTTSAATVVESGGSGTTSGSHTFAAAGTYNVSCTITDKDGGIVGCIAQIQVKSQASSNTTPGLAVEALDATVVEGSLCSASGSMFDPDGDVLTVSASVGTAVKDTIGTWHWSATFPDGSASQPVRIFATDEHGAAVSQFFYVTVVNANPTCGPIALPSSPLTGATLNFSAPFADAGVLDTHSAVWDWGDGTTSAATVLESGGAGNASGSHSYASPGTYTVTCTVTDKDGGSASCTAQIQVSNPTPVPSIKSWLTGAGFLRGAGGSRVKFGVLARYKAGVPTPVGRVFLQGPRRGVRFTSTALSSLSVAGRKATITGTGTLKGRRGRCAFVLTITDNPRKAPDRVVLRVTNPANGSTLYLIDSLTRRGAALKIHP